MNGYPVRNTIQALQDTFVLKMSLGWMFAYSVRDSLTWLSARNRGVKNTVQNVCSI
jgi:hypothetical protein